MSLSHPRLTLEYLADICSSGLHSSLLVDILSELEAAAQFEPAASGSSEFLPAYYGAYLLSLFLDNDLNEARFLVQRIPAVLAIDPQLSNAAALLRGLYSRSYRSIYAALNSPSWCATVIPLRDRCLEDFRHRTFWLLSRAYTSIAPSAVAFYLGLDAATGAVVDKLQSEGWNYDATTGLLKPFVGSGKQTTSRCEDNRIGRLTALVTHLTEG